MSFRILAVAPTRTLLVLAMLATALGCASLAPVPVYGTPGEIERLSGDWRGEYIGDLDHGRHGTIAFKLVAGEDHAHGTVVMTPAGSDEPFRPYRSGAQRNQALAIRFVNAAKGIVSGELDPYWDPDRRTEASATFRGFLGNGTIEGTFAIAYADGSDDAGGWWKVTRRR